MSEKTIICCQQFSWTWKWFYIVVGDGAILYCLLCFIYSLRPIISQGIVVLLHAIWSTQQLDESQTFSESFCRIDLIASWYLWQWFLGNWFHVSLKKLCDIYSSSEVKFKVTLNYSVPFCVAGSHTVTFSEVVLEVMRHLEGAYALIFKSLHYPNELIACKRGSPLLLGVKVSLLMKYTSF